MYVHLADWCPLETLGPAGSPWSKVLMHLLSQGDAGGDKAGNMRNKPHVQQISISAVLSGTTTCLACCSTLLLPSLPDKDGRDLDQPSVV